MIDAGCLIKGARVGLLGLTFKENVPDLRNSRVEDIIRELSDFHVSVLVHDPLADPDEARHEYGVALLPLAELRDLDALILAVPHAEFAQLDAGRIAAMFKNPENGIVIDVKGFLDRDALSRRFDYWRL
jgi:UDP-N-acetyl-D-galactosamine dehydrogenase